jgi:hypothetical protein
MATNNKKKPGPASRPNPKLSNIEKKRPPDPKTRTTKER